VQTAEISFKNETVLAIVGSWIRVSVPTFTLLIYLPSGRAPVIFGLSHHHADRSSPDIRIWLWCGSVFLFVILQGPS